jgi:FHS family L-fucose permease-like MFS transporter
MATTSSPAPLAVTPSQPASGQTYRGPFAIMSILFFMWGFMTVFNDILIPRFKSAFELNYLQASLVQLAFFGAYSIGAFVYVLTSAFTGDPIARMGYKNGVVLGLLISAAGSALFWPAAGIHSYPLFLFALFVVGIGFAVLQIAANPYVTILGPERTASSRLNLAQGFNSIGTTTGPLIAGYLILKYFARTGAHGAESVRMPYLWFCLVFLALAGVFWFVHLPHIGEGRIERGVGALKYPHVVLGMIAIFMYVGGEVSVGSYIISLLGQPSVAGLSQLEASKYVSLYWGGMLIGRFMGAVELSDMPRRNKQLWLAAFPLAGFVVLWAVSGWSVVQMYLPFLVLCWVLFQLGKSLAGRTLMMFSAMVVVLLTIAILFGGRLAMWCVVGVGLFTSIGWSNAFSLAIEGVGIYKSQASSLLVMSVFGGAVLPALQGRIADVTHNLQLSFIVPLIAYAYVAFYGWKGHRVGRSTQAT